MHSWRKLNAKESDFRLYEKMMELHKLLQKEFPESQYKEIIQSLKKQRNYRFLYTHDCTTNIVCCLKRAGYSASQLIRAK